MCVVSLKAACGDDGAIEIAPGMIGVADGQEKQVERPSRAGRIFRQDLLNLRAGNERVGRIVDRAELVDSAFTDRDLIRYFDGLICNDERLDFGHLDLTAA